MASSKLNNMVGDLKLPVREETRFRELGDCWKTKSLVTPLRIPSEKELILAMEQAILANTSTTAVNDDLANSPVSTTANLSNSSLIIRIPSVQISRPAGNYVATKERAMLVDNLEREVLDIVLPEAEREALVELGPANPPAPEGSIPTKWMSRVSNKGISAAIRSCPNDVCLYCGYQCTSRKRLLVHARLHWGHQFCPCGYASRWHETVKKHQSDETTNCNYDSVYEVDRPSYGNWQRMLNITLGPYPENIAPCTAAAPIAPAAAAPGTPAAAAPLDPAAAVHPSPALVACSTTATPPTPTYTPT